MKKILFVNDRIDYLELLIGLGARVIQVRTVARAREVFAENPDFDLIVMDGSLSDDCTLDTEDLTKEIRARFSGPMIAFSDSLEFRDRLIIAGCDHSCRDNGGPELLNKIKDLLGI